MKKLIRKIRKWAKKAYRSKKDKQILIKAGASFLHELQTNRALRKAVIKNSPHLQERLKSLGINLRKG